MKDVNDRIAPLAERHREGGNSMMEQLVAFPESALDFEIALPSGSVGSAFATHLASLTPQQRRVLDMLWLGKSNKKIAGEFDVSETTVKAHVSEILRKLRVYSRTQAVVALAAHVTNKRPSGPIEDTVGEDALHVPLGHGSAQATPMSWRLATLTRQQTRVLELMCDGRLNKTIAFALGIHETTVKAHVSEVLRKLMVASRTQAVLAALADPPRKNQSLLPKGGLDA